MRIFRWKFAKFSRGHAPGTWVAERFSRWGAQIEIQKGIEKFCGLNWQLWRHTHWNMTSLTFVSMF